MLRRVGIGLLLGAVASALALLVALSSIGRIVEDDSYDWRLRTTARPSDARPDIALILIDETSLRQFEPLFGSWPWPRWLHSGVVDFLTQGHAKVIAFDILFTERDRRMAFEAGGRQMSGAESDAEFVDAVRRAGNVVLLADAVYKGSEIDAGKPTEADPAAIPGVLRHPSPGLPVRPSLAPPFPSLAGAALGIGHNFMVKEGGGTARAFLPVLAWQGVGVPSLGLSAAIAATHLNVDDVQLQADSLSLGSTRVPLDSTPGRTGQALLNFHGAYKRPDGSTTYPTYSFVDVLLSEDRLQSGAKPPIDPAVFRDKIVFIGTSAEGLSDMWKTPFGGSAMPGVQLHAAFADDVLSSRSMRRATWGTDAAVTASVGMLTGVLATLLPVVWAVPVVAAVGIGVAGWLTHEVGAGVWLAAVAPISAVALALFEGVAWQYFVEDREKRRVKRLFGRYVSKDVFDHLMADPSIARLGGHRRDMTVLFSDIRGFTSASERGTPEAIVQQLNEYFTAMVQVLFRHHGTLDKFVGDMVMGLFGAPLDDPQHADHAVAAALEMTAVLDRLNAVWTADGRPPLDIGIGINSGEMIAGNIGSETIMSYTVIGDAVNLGARLESLNKEYGTRVLISEETRGRLSGPVRTRVIGDVLVKGRTKPVMVHEVIGDGAAAESRT
jgi:adenylate cyclase